ncbi:MAG: DUF4390 domain-containing protein [Magnetococcales bacterium]|nr:DUF4390 domain-containing protein [Magnetococcales bacterium]
MLQLNHKSLPHSHNRLSALNRRPVQNSGSNGRFRACLRDLFRFFRPTLLLLPLLIAGCLPFLDDSETPQVIRSARMTTQDKRVYVEGHLSDTFLNQLMDKLKQGEPILFTYRFGLRAIHPVLPNLEIAHIELQRRIQLHLITQKFEMRDIINNQVKFSDDPEEALKWLGHLRFIPLLDSSELELGSKYHLNVHFHLEQDGASRMFQVLNRWLTFWKPVDHSFQVRFRHR